MNCAVIIPVYRSWMEPFEKASLMRLKQLIPNDVYLIAPEGLCLDEYLELWPTLNIEYFSAQYFKSVLTYNKLMLSVELYVCFQSLNYKWMLVHQLDAFLFHADLKQFTDSSYDYFGAPWISPQVVHPWIVNRYLLKIFGTKVFVGNGGLSLRRIEPTINLLVSKKRFIDDWFQNEDGFFAYWGVKSTSFHSCPFDIAARFAFESSPEELYIMNGGVLPLGCHGLPRYNQKFYHDIINPIIKKM